VGKKSVKLKAPVEGAARALQMLRDEDFVKSTLPYLVGVSKGKVVLRFRRMMVFHFQDSYELLITTVDGNVNHMLNGERSKIRVTFSAPSKDLITAVATYEGPRAWVVGACLSNLVRALIKEAAARAPPETVTGGTTAAGHEDLSRNLALVSWVSKLLMKSLLVKSEIVAIPKGGLVNYVENLITEEVLQKYRVVYVSGTSDKGTFRLLFIDGSLAGTYVNLGGEEFVGDERALNRFDGFTKVRVYGSMIKDVSELR